MSKLSILLAHYDNDGTYQKYLDKCVDSLNQQTFKDFELIVLSSGLYEPKANTNLKSTWIHSHDRLHFPAAIKRAYEASDKNTEFILLLNNDTVLSKHCLESLIETIIDFPKEIILNPLCNSDAFGFFYFARTGYFKNDDVHFFTKMQYTFEEMGSEDLTDQYRYDFACVPVGFSPFYCTLMRRSTYEKVGGIDVRYQTNRDDLDFSLRARQYGIHSIVAMHAACFHFGGATSSKTKTEAEEHFNRELFKSKHGFYP